MTESLPIYSMNTQSSLLLWNNTERPQINTWGGRWVEKGGCPSHHKRTRELLNVSGGPSSKAYLRAEDGVGFLPYSEQSCEALLNWKNPVLWRKVFQSSGILCDLAKSFLKLLLSNSIQFLNHTHQ